MGLNARRIRKSLLETFEVGVLVRQYPFPWSVWLDVDNESKGQKIQSSPIGKLLLHFGFTNVRA
eukprot:jgi/Galph1/1414/GphlegSOOS_G109.1